MAFNVNRAVIQMFVDSVIAALNAKPVGDGYGYGWHMTYLFVGDSNADATFETTITLKGWDPEGKTQTEGPHRIDVKIEMAR